MATSAKLGTMLLLGLSVPDRGTWWGLRARSFIIPPLTLRLGRKVCAAPNWRCQLRLF